MYYIFYFDDDMKSIKSHKALSDRTKIAYE